MSYSTQVEDTGKSLAESSQNIMDELEAVFLAAEQAQQYEEEQEKRELEQFAKETMNRDKIAGDTTYTAELLAYSKASEETKLVHKKNNPLQYNKAGQRIIYKGRETVTISDLPKQWKYLLVELGKRGSSINEMCLALDISISTKTKLLKNSEEFELVFEKARMLSEAWWTSIGKDNLDNKRFNSGLWYMNMKNRHGWKDRADVKLEQRTDTVMTLLTKTEEEQAGKFEDIDYIES